MWLFGTSCSSPQITDIIRWITESENYNEDIVKEWLKVVVSKRNEKQQVGAKEKEESKLEAGREWERDREEKERERKREERMLEREYELQKVELQSKQKNSRDGSSTSGSGKQLGCKK